MLFEPGLDALCVDDVAAWKAFAGASGHIRLTNYAGDVVSLGKLFGCDCGEPRVDGGIDGSVTQEIADALLQRAQRLQPEQF